MSSTCILNPNALPFNPHPPTTSTVSSSLDSTLNVFAQPFQPNSSSSNHSTQSSSHVSVAVINARSINNKLGELSILCNAKKPDIICITETWLTTNHTLHLPNYAVFRRDRPQTPSNPDPFRGYGGVAILVLTTAFSKVREIHSFRQQNFEAIAIEATPIGSSQPLSFACLYRPPNQPAADLQYFVDTLRTALIKLPAPSSTIVTGDFNAHCQSWCASDSTSAAGSALCNLFRSIALSQLVTFPTHLTSNGPRGCLDLVATNIPERFTSIESLSPLGASDHLIVLGRLSIAKDIAQSRESTSDTALPRFSHHLLTQSQWEGVNAEIAATHWSDRLCGLDIDTAVSNFSSVLESSLSVCSSHRDHQSTTRNRSRPSRQDPPWMTPVLRAGIKRKHDLYSIYKNTLPRPMQRSTNVSGI